MSVTSPVIEDRDDILLGVVQAESSKGCDQADVTGIKSSPVRAPVEDCILNPRKPGHQSRKR
jgi:hypothetical protein